MFFNQTNNLLYKHFECQPTILLINTTKCQIVTFGMCFIFFRSYYFCEVPRTSIELSPQIFKRNQDDIQTLKTVLGASDMLINID